MVKTEKNLEWDDIMKIWSSMEIILTEVDTGKINLRGVPLFEQTATFQFKDWDSLKFTLLTLCRDERYVKTRLEGEIQRYLDNNPEYGQEQLNHWKEYDEEGFEFTLVTYATVTVFPKKNQIIFQRASFHHFFQHAFEWFPIELNNRLLDMDIRRNEIARYIDDDTNIPVSRQMISRGFSISSQTYIDEKYNGSIKAFLLEENADDKLRAQPWE